MVVGAVPSASVLAREARSVGRRRVELVDEFDEHVRHVGVEVVRVLGDELDHLAVAVGSLATVAAQHRHSEKLPCFRWVNTVLGNVKTAIVGTLKSVAGRYVFRYLAEFQYRFNRRFKLPELLNRLASVATRAAPRPYKTLKILHMAG